MLLHSYLFTRYSFDQQIANANRGGQIFFSSLTYFNYTGNKTEKKKYNMKRQKDTHEKQKRKIANVHCKGEKVLEFLASSVSMVPFGVWEAGTTPALLLLDFTLFYFIITIIIIIIIYGLDDFFQHI